MRKEIKIVYPDYPPGVIATCSSRFPPLHVTQMCPFPGLMVEVSRCRCWQLLNNDVCCLDPSSIVPRSQHNYCAIYNSGFWL
jgi:hypothetical protein